MGLFKRKARDADTTSVGGGAAPLVDAARSMIETNLGGARFLAQPGKFDRPKMEEFLALSGEPFEGLQREQLLNANDHILPRKAADGTWMDGYEIMRWQLFGVHIEGVQAGIELLRRAASPEALANLAEIIAEIEDLQRSSRKVEP